MALFGKKAVSSEAFAETSARVPTDRVIQMRQQGLSNNQITQTLQREGYTTSQIFDAMSQADIKNIVESAPPDMNEEEFGQMPGQMNEMQQMPPMQEDFSSMPPPMPSHSAPAPTGQEHIEEIAEAIINEKWDELMKGVDKIVAWKESTEERLTRIEQDIENLKSNFKELQRGVFGKISDYDQGIKDVSSDLKAMEGVFKKVLPT